MSEYVLTERIGNTTFRVHVKESAVARESLESKVKAIIREDLARECRQETVCQMENAKRIYIDAWRMKAAG